MHELPGTTYILNNQYQDIQDYFIWFYTTKKIVYIEKKIKYFNYEKQIQVKPYIIKSTKPNIKC